MIAIKFSNQEEYKITLDIFNRRGWKWKSGEKIKDSDFSATYENIALPFHDDFFRFSPFVNKNYEVKSFDDFWKKIETPKVIIQCRTKPEFEKLIKHFKERNFKWLKKDMISELYLEQEIILDDEPSIWNSENFCIEILNDTQLRWGYLLGYSDQEKAKIINPTDYYKSLIKDEIICCETKEEYYRVIDKLYLNGYTWTNTGRKILEKDKGFWRDTRKICIIFGKELSIVFYKNPEEFKPTISVEDFLELEIENKTENIKVNEYIPFAYEDRDLFMNKIIIHKMGTYPHESTIVYCDTEYVAFVISNFQGISITQCTYEQALNYLLFKNETPFGKLKTI